MNPYSLPSATIAPAVVAATTTSPPDDGASAVSWGSIFAGATAASALSLVLLLLGTGFGMGAVSPWSPRAPDMGFLSLASVIWLSMTQLLAAGVGGYLAGRLRTRWLLAETDEVFFRDTAHGMLVWAVSTLVTASILSSSIANVIGAAGSVAVAATPPTAVDSSSTESRRLQYHVDLLMRSAVVSNGSPALDTARLPVDTRRPIDDLEDEAFRILQQARDRDELPPADAAYLAARVSARSALPAADARARVIDTFAHVRDERAAAARALRDSANEARKMAAHAAAWMVVSLFLGAFVASWAATLGGRLRDRQSAPSQH